MSLGHVGKAKPGAEIYTQAAVSVRLAAVAMWEAVIAAGAPRPEGFTGGPNEWVSQDRNRAMVRASAAGFPTPEVKAAERAYTRAFNSCIKTNMGLVFKVAAKLIRKAKSRGLEQEDLIQEGVLGMQRSLETFDPEKKVSFSTYSFFWIYQTIDRSINNSGTIRVPIRTQDLSAKGKKAGHLGDRAREASRVLSLDASLDHDENVTLMDIISSKGPSPEDTFKQKQDHETLGKVLSTLTEKELTVLHGRYAEDKTLEEIGATMSLTRERIRQIEGAALAKMRLIAGFGKVGFNG